MQTPVPAARKQGRRLAGRAGWNLADQIVSSGTNLLLSVLAARALTIEGFGAFSIAFAVYVFLVGASRALIAQPLTVRYVAGGPEVFRRAALAATGGAGLLGGAGGIAVLLVGLGVGGEVGRSLIAIGVLLPGLLLQDMWRAVFIAEGRPERAFVNDIIWAIVQCVAIGLLIAFNAATGSALILAWGVAALAAAAVGGLQFRGMPRFAASIPWLRQNRDLLGYYAASFFTVLGTNQVVLFLLAALGSPAVVGALRAAQVVLGPLNLAGYSLQAFALPEISRRRLSGRRALQVAAGISGIMVVVDLIWGLTLILLPPDAGAQLLGQSWTSAQAVLPASLLGIVAIGLGLGASVLMSARGYAKESFRINALITPSFFVLGLGGFFLYGAVGAALGLSLAQVVVLPVVWWRIIVLMRREAAASGAAAGSAGGADGAATAGIAPDLRDPQPGGV